MNLRKQIGPALSLLLLFWLHTPDGWNGLDQVPVAGGNVISDEELAAWLDAKPSTVEAWRRRLRKAGLLDWLVKPGMGRQLFVKGFHQIFGGPAAEQPAVAAKPATGTEPKAQAKPAAAAWVH
jgi:hypothetical protein